MVMSKFYDSSYWKSYGHLKFSKNDFPATLVCLLLLLWPCQFFRQWHKNQRLAWFLNSLNDNIRQRCTSSIVLAPLKPSTLFGLTLVFFCMLRFIITQRVATIRSMTVSPCSKPITLIAACVFDCCWSGKKSILLRLSVNRVGSVKGCKKQQTSNYSCAESYIIHNLDSCD